MSDMLADMPADKMWTLADNKEVARLQVPPILLDGWLEPLRIHLDFDTEMVDEILKRLTLRRLQMLPLPQRI